jgi:hypothetical protein
MTDLVIVGDEAWTREEWDQAERKRAKRREYEQRPEVRARKNAYWREYRKQPRVKAYQREWKRADRAKRRTPKTVAVGALHSLRCWGPHRYPRKGCHPIPVYRREDVAA